MYKVQKVLQSAIDAINEARNQIKELCDVHNTPYPITSLVRYNQAIKGCKSALTDIEKYYGGTTPVSEPVGYGVQLPTGMYGNIYTMKHEAEEDFKNWKHKYPESKVIPLYTSPISKEWVGLSDQQIQNLIINSDNYNKFQFIKSVEHTVKQLNAPDKG